MVRHSGFGHFSLSVLGAGAMSIGMTTLPGPAVAQTPASPPTAGAADKSAAKRRGPADAAATIESGVKQLEAGKTEQAVQTLSYAIAGGNIPPTQMARALHQRGIAYRRINKPAQAISDLTSALWLKNGLDAGARADALAQRTEAYREAGLAQPAEATAATASQPAPVTAPPAAPTRTTAARTAPTASPAPAPITTTSLAPDSSSTAAPTADPVGAFFTGLFGGATATPVASPAPAPVTSEPVTSGWASTTTAKTSPGPTRIATASVKPPTAAAATAPRAPVTAAPSESDGRYGARLGSFTSQAEATAAAQKLATQFGAALSGRTTQADRMTFGGRTIWHLRVGPYMTAAQASAACVTLKPANLDCVPVDR